MISPFFRCLRHSMIHLIIIGTCQIIAKKYYLICSSCLKSHSYRIWNISQLLCYLNNFFFFSLSTYPLLLSTLETTDTDTPAFSATSFLVIFFSADIFYSSFFLVILFLSCYKHHFICICYFVQ